MRRPWVIGGAILRLLLLTEGVLRIDAQPRTRSGKRDGPAKSSQPECGAHQIVIAMNWPEYDRIWGGPAAFRRRLQEQFECAPELFPDGFAQGFKLDGLLPESKKLACVRLRMIVLRDDSIYELCPSLALPYMVGTIEDLVEAPLLLLSFGVPNWVVPKIVGRSDVYCHRILERWGRCGLIGTTVCNAERLPEDLLMVMSITAIWQILKVTSPLPLDRAACWGCP